MYILFALAASMLTSLLPILNKQMVQHMRPVLVAWAVNLASLPILAIGTIFLTHAVIPQVDAVFALALLSSAVLNWGATVLSTRALALADASLVTPLLTFNPAFTLLVAWMAIGETPGVRESLGVIVILLGTYLLDIETEHTRLLAPLYSLMRRPGTLLAIVASALWGITTVLEKLAIEHATPPSGPLAALVGTSLTVLLLTPGALFTRQTNGTKQPHRTQGLSSHLRSFSLAAVIAGIAPLFGFTAIALGHVGYVTALFKLSAILTLFWARLFLKEGAIRQRLLGTTVMLIGGALIAF